MPPKVSPFSEKTKFHPRVFKSDSKSDVTSYLNISIYNSIGINQIIAEKVLDKAMINPSNHKSLDFTLSLGDIVSIIYVSYLL